MTSRTLTAEILEVRAKVGTAVTPEEKQPLLATCRRLRAKLERVRDSDTKRALLAELTQHEADLEGRGNADVRMDPPPPISEAIERDYAAIVAATGDTDNAANNDAANNGAVNNDEQGDTGQGATGTGGTAQRPAARPNGLVALSSLCTDKSYKKDGTERKIVENFGKFLVADYNAGNLLIYGLAPETKFTEWLRHELNFVAAGRDMLPSTKKAIQEGWEDAGICMLINAVKRGRAQPESLVETLRDTVGSHKKATEIITKAMRLFIMFHQDETAEGMNCAQLVGDAWTNMISEKTELSIPVASLGVDLGKPATPQRKREREARYEQEASQQPNEEWEATELYTVAQTRGRGGGRHNFQNQRGGGGNLSAFRGRSLSRADEKTDSYGNRLCFHCDSPDHYASSCPHNADRRGGRGGGFQDGNPRAPHTQTRQPRAPLPKPPRAGGHDKKSEWEDHAAQFPHLRAQMEGMGVTFPDGM